MTLKIIVMGVGGVGKSAITQRFVVGRWVDKVSDTDALLTTEIGCTLTIILVWIIVRSNY
jgi:GTPase SAR1 family protein